MKILLALGATAAIVGLPLLAATAADDNPGAAEPFLPLTSAPANSQAPASESAPAPSASPSTSAVVPVPGQPAAAGDRDDDRDDDREGDDRDDDRDDDDGDREDDD